MEAHEFPFRIGSCELPSTFQFRGNPFFSMHPPFASLGINGSRMRNCTSEVPLPSLLCKAITCLSSFVVPTKNWDWLRGTNIVIGAQHLNNPRFHNLARHSHPTSLSPRCLRLKGNPHASRRRMTLQALGRQGLTIESSFRHVHPALRFVKPHVAKVCQQATEVPDLYICPTAFHICDSKGFW